MLKKTRFILFVLSFALVIGLVPTAIIAEQFGLASEEETRAIENPPLASGVYRINSLGTDSYLETQGGLTSGSAVTLAPDDGNTREQLYKVVLVRTFQTIESDNLRFQYVIRPMTNNGLALYAPTTGSSRTTSVVTASASDSYSSLSSDVLWEITEDSGALLLSNDLGTSFLKASNGTPTVSSGGGADAWWQFEAYTGSAMEGITTNLANTSTIIMGNSYYVAMYSTVIGKNALASTTITNLDGQSASKLTLGSDGLLNATQGGTVQISCYLNSTDSTPALTRQLSIKTSTCLTVPLGAIYDGGYNQRFTGAYTRILENLYDLQTFYINEFDIWVNFSTPSMFTSYADQCSGKAVTEKCGCATHLDCHNSNPTFYAMYHHTNMYNIYYRISGLSSSGFQMVFIGHPLCRRGDNNSCENVVVHGLSFQNSNGIIMNCTGVQARELSAMVHELGHKYGAEDHYGGNDAPSTDDMGGADNGYSVDCIYGENRDDEEIYEGLVICTACSNKIWGVRND